MLAIVGAYLEDNQSKRVDICLWRRQCAFFTIFLRYQEFRRHKRYGATFQLCAARHRLDRVKDHSRKAKVREASVRRGVIGHENVSLLNVRKRLVAK